jgi:DNA-binding transcriptional MocR family regulator
MQQFYCYHNNIPQSLVSGKIMWKPDLKAYPGPKYAAICEALCADIRSGRLRPGERLPPQRELADALKVNFGTVTKAYALASERGLIRGETGRGTFVRQDAPASRTPWPQERPAPGRLDMRSDFPCSLSEDPAFRKAFERLGRHPDFDRLLQYQPGSALPAHQEAAAVWLRRMGLEAPAQRIAITCGALHGGFLALMAIAAPGDTIFTEAMTSPAIRSIAAMRHLALKPVAVDEDGLVPADLEEKLGRSPCKALYLTPNFQNPTTALMPLERRRTLARLARQHDLYIIEDDVFGCLLPDPALPISALVPERAFYLTSFSKGIAPGLRIGYAVAPEPFYQRLLTGLRVTTWMASPLLVEVVSGWIHDGTAERLVRLQAGKIAAREAVARRCLAGLTLNSRPHCPHLWLTLPPSMRESEAVMALGQAGIDVTPGEYFAVGSGVAPGKLRLCLGQAEDLSLLEERCRSISAILSQASGLHGLSATP